MYNNVYTLATLAEISTHVIIYHNGIFIRTHSNDYKLCLFIFFVSGTVMWLTATVYKSSCLINVQYFPFDIQNCSLIFASWTYDAAQLDILKLRSSPDVSNYLKNDEWSLEHMSSFRHIKKYSCCINA